MRFLLIGFLLLAPAAYPQNSPAPAASSSQAVALASQALAALTGSVQVNDATLTGCASPNVIRSENGVIPGDERLNENRKLNQQ